MNVRSQKPVRATKWNFAILTYGNLAETKQCLRTLAATMDEPFSVFVVDNASTDGTQEWLKAHPAEWLHWQCNTQNRGVPGGRNDLLDFALPHLRGEDWVVFCDNDLEFAPGWLEHFRCAMREFPSARLLGQVGHLIEVRDDRRILLPAPHTPSPVDVLSGGFACMVRADTALAIGPFDEKLGLFWHEDDDYCVRALQLQVEIVAVPHAGIVHHEHATGVATSGLREGGSRRNLAYLVRKWRELGFVDDGGWIRQRSGVYREPSIRTELQRRAGSPRPIGRAEFATAYRLLETLVAAPDPAKTFDAAREPLPPCWSAFVQWNLEVARADGALELIERLLRIVEITERIRYSALLKPMLRVPDPRTEGPAGHGVCSSADFDDPEWLLAADELDPMHCARDPQARDRVFWEEVSLVLSLQRSGAVHAESTVLGAGDVRPRVRNWLAARARSVVEFDPVAPPPPQSCDVVVCVRAHSANALSLIRHCAAAGATFAFAGDVALDGVPSRNEPQPMQLEHELGPRVGAQPLWTVRTAVDDALLEACADGARNEHRLPQLCTYAQRLRTSFVLLARCAEAAAKTASVLTPARSATATIGIDLRTVAYADSTSRGIGHYTIHHLAAVAARAPDLHLRCYLPHDAEMPAALLLPNVHRAEVDDYRAEDVDLVHVPDPMNLSIGFDSPLRTFRHERTTVTFHDLTPLRHYIAQWPLQNREAYLDRVRQIERSEAHLLCNSQFTADDVVATLRRDAATVTPILAGLNGARGVVEASLQENVRRRLGIRGPFVLHVGALDPHKNFPAALSAFLQVRGRRPLQLVVVGAVDPGIEHFAELCSRKRIPDVVFTGYLPRRDLDALYASAVALLFLSKSEGFGFPLLEAMAAGCPVIGSDVTSHPEVVGTAGILVPLATAAESAADALMRLLSDPAHAARLRAAGSAQAATFTWDSVADRTLQVWRSMLGARELALPAFRAQLAPLPVGL